MFGKQTDGTKRPRLGTVSRSLIGVATLLTLGVLTLYFDAQAGHVIDSGPIPKETDNLLLPPVPVLKALGLGQDTLVGSILWVKALAYFGERFSLNRRYRWLRTYVDTIADVDPRFRRVFEWGGVVVMYGGTIDNASVRVSNEVLERGVELFPDDWQLAFMLGCNYAFELHTKDPEQKKRNIETALIYLRRASYAPGAPAHIIAFVGSLYRRVGWTETAAAYLEEAYLHTDQEELRATLAMQLKRYRSEAEMDRLKLETERLNTEWKATFPYLDRALFRVVGVPEQLPPGDWRELLGREDFSQEQQEDLLDLIVGEDYTGGSLRRREGPAASPAGPR